MPPRLTRNQRRILEQLGGCARPLSAQDLHAELRQHHYRIGLATIYRALEALKLKGLVQSRMAASGESLYSSTHHERHYLTCLQCGMSIPLDSCPVKALEEELRQSLAFKIYYHSLEFFGLCSSCQWQLSS